MANLIRRDNRDATQSTTNPNYRLDPLRVMDALLRWDPFRGEWSGMTQAAEFAPHFDLKETKDAFVIHADLPGVKDDDLNLSLTGNLLTISGKREDEKRQEGEAYYAVERSHGTFTRSFTMPESVEADAVSADLKNGVLTVRLPKKPEAQPRRIAIGKSEGTGAKA
jgi:HSP20 family protein